MGNANCGLFACVGQGYLGVIERYGRFRYCAQPGLHLVNVFAGDWVAGFIVTDALNLKLEIKAKTKDNASVIILLVVEHCVGMELPEQAFYELPNPTDQIKSYVFAVVRALVPKWDLMDCLSQMPVVGEAIKEELEKVIEGCGYCIKSISLRNIIVDPNTREAISNRAIAQLVAQQVV